MGSATWRTRVASITPGVIKDWRRAAALARIRHRNAGRSAGEVFSEIYASGGWGQTDAFDSGPGSYGEGAQRYAEYVRTLVGRLGARSVVDVGCGDFQVARQFVDCVESYHGVDVAPNLISRNVELYGDDRVRFSVLDAAVERLPDGDICLIRQVLQHLSNRQVAAILRQCRRFSLVVVTEHWPAESRMSQPNRDKPHGPDTRLDSGSWVDIAAQPFACSPAAEALRLPAVPPLYHDGETIRTHLWWPAAGTDPTGTPGAASGADR